MQAHQHQQYLEAPYLAADLADEHFEQWTERRGGGYSKHSHTAAAAADQVARALIGDCSAGLTTDQWRDAVHALTAGLLEHGSPEVRAMLGAAIGLWPDADSDEGEARRWEE